MFRHDDFPFTFLVKGCLIHRRGQVIEVRTQLSSKLIQATSSEAASGCIFAGLPDRLLVDLDVVLVLGAAFTFVDRGSSAHAAARRVVERVTTAIMKMGEWFWF